MNWGSAGLMKLSYEGLPLLLLLWLASRLEEEMIPTEGLDPNPSTCMAGSWDLLPWRLLCFSVRERELRVRELSCSELEMALGWRGSWTGRLAWWLPLKGLFLDSEQRSGPLLFPCCSDVFSNWARQHKTDNSVCQASSKTMTYILSCKITGLKKRVTCSGGIGDDPLDIASSTGRSWGTVGIDTGMMDLVWCPISEKEVILWLSAVICKCIEKKSVNAFQQWHLKGAFKK